MRPSATRTGRPPARRRTFTLLVLTLIVLSLALALPAAAPAAPYGQISGTVTNASAVGLVGIYVVAYYQDGSGDWQPVNDTSTVAGGAYVLGNLEAGLCRVEFYDDSGAYATQWYNNKPAVDAANDIAVTSGATTSGINATLAAAGHITGTVTNASAVGLSGIVVSAYRADGSGIPQWYVGGTSTTAGAYDLGRLPAGTYRIEFRDSSGAYIGQWYNNKPWGDLSDDVAVTVGATTSGINAVLVAAGHISGTVKNASAAGLVGIQVTASRSDGSGGWDEAYDTSTGAGGAYNIGGLRAGSYRVGFYDATGSYVTQYYNNKPTFGLADSVPVTAGATTSAVNAVLATAGRISGAVTQAGGGGLTDASVTAYRPDGIGGWEEVKTTLTAAGGTYEFGGLRAGIYRVAFYVEFGPYIGQYYSNKPTLQLADDVVVTGGATTSGINAALALAGHISGTVRNVKSTGLVGISVTAYAADGYGWWTPLKSTQTAAGGAYDLGDLPAGSYRIRFDDGSGVYASPQYYNNKYTLTSADDVAVTVGATTSGINAVLVAASHIRGTVRNASAAGLAGIDVIAFSVSGSEEKHYASTSASGDYDLGSLPAASYHIGFLDESGAYVEQYYNNKPTLALADSVAVTTGATTFGINAVLATAGHITGTVTSTATGGGRVLALSGIWVHPYRADGSGGWDLMNGSTARTTAAGVYDVGGLPTGSYRIEFSDSSGAYLGQYYNDKPTLALADTVAVTAGATTPGIDAMLAPAGHITGTVTKAGGGGVACEVVAYRADGSGGWTYEAGLARPDPTSGAYDLGGLPTGSYRIGFFGESGAYVTQYYNNKPTLADANEVAVTAGATTPGINATLALVGHITGTVKNASAAGLVGISVTAYRDDGSGYWDLEVKSTSTATSGAYDLGGLPAGTYRVRFSDASGTYLSQCYNNKPTLALANDVAVSAGATTSGINAVLALAGHISGTVKNASGASLDGIEVMVFPSGSQDHVRET